MKTLLIQFVFWGGGGGRKKGVFLFRAKFSSLGEKSGEKLFFAYNL